MLLPDLLLASAMSPSSSCLGHRFAKKSCDKTTIPARDALKPLLTASWMLSPMLSVNSSYQTRAPLSSNALARGRTKESLSSLAWLMKKVVFVPRAGYGFGAFGEGGYHCDSS